MYTETHLNEFRRTYHDKNYYLFLTNTLNYSLIDIPSKDYILNDKTFSILQYFYFFYFYRFNFLNYFTDLKYKNMSYYINNFYTSWYKSLSSEENYKLRFYHSSRSHGVRIYYWSKFLTLHKNFWLYKKILNDYYTSFLHRYVDCRSRLKHFRLYFSDSFSIILRKRRLKTSKLTTALKPKRTLFKLLLKKLSLYRRKWINIYYIYYRDFLLYLNAINFNVFHYFFYKTWFIYKFYKIRSSVYYYFLLLRFSIISISSFNFFVSNFKWRKTFLPIFANINLVPNFIKYRGIFLTLGSFNFLRDLTTYSGYKLPYIILKSKKSFWKSITGCFAIYSYSFISTHLSTFVFPHLTKLSLFDNFPLKLGWFVATRSIFRYNVNYEQLSYFYFSAKTLLTQRFFSGCMNISAMNQHYLTRFLGNSVYPFKFGSDVKKYKRPINLVVRQITVLRRIRDSLRLFYFNKPVRSWFMTRFCKTLTRLDGFRFLYKFELYLSTLLLRSKVVYTMVDAEWMIDRGLVFVNGVVCFDKYYAINKYDRIQIGLTKQLHLWHRECLSEIRNDFKSLYPFVFARLKKRTLLEKMRKNISGIWPLKTMWWKHDIPRYLEVDYITMTIFVLYLPFSLKDLFPYNLFFYKVLANKCYNWRFYF